MIQNIIMLGNMVKFKLKEFFSDEKGDVNVVAIVVLIGIAVLLALLFREKIEELLVNLFKTIDGTVKQAIAPVAGE